MKQTVFWSCDGCGKDGSVKHAEHADVYSVVNLLRSDHETISPDCETGISQVRVCPAPIRAVKK